jgi:hypothetical protein
VPACLRLACVIVFFVSVGFSVVHLHPSMRTKLIAGHASTLCSWLVAHLNLHLPLLCGRVLCGCPRRRPRFDVARTRGSTRRRTRAA